MNENEKQALSEALKYLTAKDRSSRGVALHLQEKAYQKETIQSVLAYLQAKKMIDDFRYADNYFHKRLKSGYSIHQISEELKQEGLPDEVIEDARSRFMEELSDGIRAKEEAEKLLSQFGYSAKTMRKIAGFLERKGYEAELVEEILFFINEKYE